MQFRSTISNEELFHQLLAMEPAERQAFLNELRAQDAERADLLHKLLASDQRDTTGILGSGRADDNDDAIPLHVGVYEISRLVGQGGMGRVFEALHPPTGRICALKLLQPGLASRRNLSRFRREAEVLGRLDHAGVARIYDAGLATAVYSNAQEADQPYLAMEFIAGTDVLAHVRSQNTSLADCARLIAEAADAVHHAHNCGIIHRDLKPANVMVTADGEAKVVDFGIARLAEEHGDSTTGLMPGTAAYMSPEQLSGLRDRIDTRTDVYGLGATLYAVVVGQHPPLGGLNRELPSTWRTGKPDRRLTAILRKAMARASEERYTSAAQFAEELRNWSSGDAILARPERLDWLRRLRRTHPRLLYGGVATVTLTSILLANPSWQTVLRARLLPARSRPTIVLEFESSAAPGGNSSLAGQLAGLVKRELHSGGLLEPLNVSETATPRPSGSGELLLAQQMQQLQRLGARYAVTGDFDVSGSQPWSTLELRARLVEVPTGRTVEMVTVQGSLAEAEALAEDAALRMTEAVGGREQTLRLQPRAAREVDPDYTEGLSELARFEDLSARTRFLRALNRNFANVDARLALVQALDDLGYREQALRQAVLCENLALTGEQKAHAAALHKALSGDRQGGLRELLAFQPLDGADWHWQARMNGIEDMISIGKVTEAATLVEQGLAESSPQDPLWGRWVMLKFLVLREGTTRQPALKEARQMVEAARAHGHSRALAFALNELAEELTFAGDQEGSIAALRQSAEIFANVGDRNGRITALAALGQREQIHGSNGRSIEMGTELLRDVTHTEFAHNEEVVTLLLGGAYSRGYDALLSRQMLSRALVLSWAQPESHTTRMILWRLGITARELGEFAETRRVLQLSIASGQDEVAARSWNSLAETEIIAGHPDAALDAAKHAADYAGAAEDISTDAMTARTRALALRKDFSNLDANFTRAREIAVRRGMRGSEAIDELQWGECLLWRNLPREAVPHLEHAEKILAEIDRPAYRAQAASTLSVALARSGRLVPARAAFARSAAVPSMPKFAYSRVMHHIAEGQLAATEGDKEAAHRMLAAAENECRKMELMTAAMLARQSLERL